MGMVDSSYRFLGNVFQRLPRRASIRAAVLMRLQIKYRAGNAFRALLSLPAETAPMPERKKSPTVETAGRTRQEDAEGGNMVSGSLNRGCLNATGWLRCAHILPIHIWPEGIERNFSGRLSRQLDG
jgi:hypothetical protein